VTARRLGIIAVVAVVIALGLAVAIRSLTGGGVAIPTESPDPGAASTPSPSPSIVGLPRHDLTPGAINPAATQDNLATTVCKSGWATSVRPPSAYTSALKLVQIIEYDYTDKSPSHYQEDHLVPLELGGAPRDRRNLWPEPNTITLADGTSIGSKEKDDLEDYLHDQVCGGSMSLQQAQLAIARDWVAAWQAAGRP
jgi:hypothetical protein